MAFDWKLLINCKLIPTKVVRFGKTAHFGLLRWKSTDPLAKFPGEEVCVRPIDHWLELAHVDVVSFNERLDFTRASPAVLDGRDHPIKDGLRFQPGRRGAARTRFIS